MPLYPFNLKLEASSQDEADIKAKAVGIMLKKLKTKELAKLADILENDPITTYMAKKKLGL